MIPTAYSFIQKIDYPNLLAMTIMHSGFSTALDHIETNGSGINMCASIWFVDALSQADINTLTTIMQNYSNPTNTQQMVSNITTAIQGSNDVLLLLLKTKVLMTIPTCYYGELQAICTLLGLSTA